MPQLHCLTCPEHGRTRDIFELVFRRSVLGRGRWCDVRLPDGSLRRRHAVIAQLGDGRLVLAALHPRAAVVVNGERISSPRELSAGDVVELGATRLRVQLDEPRPAGVERARGRLWRGTLRLAAGTFASRALGMVREAVAGAYFGASGAMDVFVIAFTVPNLFRRVLGEHVVEGSLVPVLRGLLARGKSRLAWASASSALTLTLSLVVVLMGCCLVAAPWMVRALAPGFGLRDAALWATAATLARVMVPFMGLIVLFAFLGSLLLVSDRFGAYGLAPAMFSLGGIAAVVALYRPLNVYALAVGVLAGGAAHVAVQAIALRGSGARLRPRWRFDDPGTTKVLAMAGPLMLTALVMRGATVVDRILASGLPEGSVSALWWSFRLVGMPFGVLGLAIARTSFARLAEQSAAAGPEDFGRSLGESLRLCAMLLVPATALMALLAPQIVIAVHQYRSFDAEDVRLTAIALRFYSLALVGMSASALLNRAMYALLDSRTPFYTSLLNMATNITFDLILVQTALRHAGLALATAIAFTAQMLALGWAVERTLRARGAGLPLGEIASAVARIAAAAAALCAAVVAVKALCAAWWVRDTMAARVALVALPATAGGIAYALGAMLLRLKEARELVRMFRTRRS